MYVSAEKGVKKNPCLKRRASKGGQKRSSVAAFFFVISVEREAKQKKIVLRPAQKIANGKKVGVRVERSENNHHNLSRNCGKFIVASCKFSTVAMKPRLKLHKLSATDAASGRRWKASRGRMASPKAQALTTLLLMMALLLQTCHCNLPPIFTQDMNNLALSESTPLGTVVYRLEGYDPEGGAVSFGLLGSDNFMVDSISGDVKVIRPLDREAQDTLSFSVTIKDRVNASFDSENDNVVNVPITIIVLDENDNPPEFRNVPYETEVLENAKPGTTVFGAILVTDKDTVGENLDITCIPQPLNPDACDKFSIEVTESSQDRLTAAVVLNGHLDYNERMIYQILLEASDGMFNASAGLEIHVKDVQNAAPVFQGSLAAVINEDSPIGTLVMTIHARDGDRGQPRKIVYELVTNPMDYFLLDRLTGELRTAKPLDKEALPDDTGLIILTVKARELIDGVPGNDELTVASTQASITIRDVNDSPPMFNKKEYFVSMSENTAPGTPLPIEMSVHDPDVGENAEFSLRLNDVSEVFDVEPKLVTGSSQISIRVANGSLDYENPNQRKFIVLVIAEETKTNPKLSSTATLTVSITDSNDNRPIFEQDSYSTTVSETANPGHLISTITAKDLDSGHFGDQSIRYSLSGTGAELFHVDPITGAITVAECPAEEEHFRKRRQIPTSDELIKDFPTLKKFNVSTDGRTGIVDRASDYMAYQIFNGGESSEFRDVNVVAPPTSSSSWELSSAEESDSTTSWETTSSRLSEDLVVPSTTARHSSNEIKSSLTDVGPGRAPCLDYETQTVYYLSYKATDDEGRGQTSVVSLRITLLDANDSPPVCESPLYRASVDEGATHFEPPLVIKARDPDVVSEINYRIIGNEAITRHFEIDKRSGQLTISRSTTLDVNHLKSENVFFAVEASDGRFTTLCNVNITIRDVNNHGPQFSREHYLASIEENFPIGTKVEQLEAIDLDTGINAEIRYRIQQGNFDDFAIDNRTGVVTIARKLDYDRRNTYQMEIVASDLGTPSLSGTTTLTVSIINSNDKAPYFTPTTQRAEISEDAPVGTLVHTLVALDPDVASSEALDYAATEPITAVDKNGKEVTEGDVGAEDFKDMFTIDRTGKVYVNRRLQRDDFAVVRITVLVTDTTAPAVQQGEGLLIITIIDVNEEPPLFVPPWRPDAPRYRFQIQEEQPIGTILTTMQATDADSTVAEYRMTDNGYFEIDNTTGLIRSKSRIDYEQIAVIKFNVTVVDTGIPQLSSTAEVTVDIINANDNDPHFEAPQYSMTVPENAPIGTKVGTVKARDADSGSYGEITYSLVGDRAAAAFSLDPDTGLLSVRNSSALDREREPEIGLTVIAADRAPEATRRSTTAPISIRILDENDNAPIFSQKIYHATVAENAALNPPAAILQVSASDPDEGPAGDVKYSIVRSDIENTFRLDANSGILYPGVSLLGLNGQYSIEIEARDGLGSGPHSDTAEIRIEIQSINQHRPVFIMPALFNATVEIPENLAMTDYLVMTVKATDNDDGSNGKVLYHLQVNNRNVQETDEFSINEMSGELRIRKPLDRKKQPRFQLILVARDQGTPSAFETLRFLTVLLVDVNENHPEFPDASNPYKLFIAENGPRDIRIGKIQAFYDSPDPKIYYYMLLGNEDGAFYLDKNTGDIFTNKSLDREEMDMYALYIQASKKSDLLISERDRMMMSIKKLERDSTVAKVWVTVLDVNDNPPVFKQDVYYAGVSSKAAINELVTIVNATDKDSGANSTMDLFISGSFLYKYGATKTTGSIVPSPFTITKEGRIATANYMAEYNQDRFILEVVAKEVESPERVATAKVYVWIFNPEQLVRVILSRPPSEVHLERDEIVSELSNATQKMIIVDEIRYHVDSMGRIRMDWCDMYIHAIDMETQSIVPVEEILKEIDAKYDFLQDYNAGFSIENVVPAYVTTAQDEFDLALAAIIALLIVLFVGAVSFIVLCCCLKHWVITIPNETRRKDALIKKQIIEDLNTTENPLWIEQKLKLYEEQELTMQVFSEPELTQQHQQQQQQQLNNSSNSTSSTISGSGMGGAGLGLVGGAILHQEQSSLVLAGLAERRDSYELSQGGGDNTYATIQPRNYATNLSTVLGSGGGGGGGTGVGSGGAGGPVPGNAGALVAAGFGLSGEMADYATLRNSRAPSNLAMTDYLVMTVKATDNDDGSNGKVLYHLQVTNRNVQETDEFSINEMSGELRIRKSLDRKKQPRFELILVARDQGTPSAFETLRFLTVLLVDVNENHPEFPDASNPYKLFIAENGPRDIRIGKIQAFYDSPDPKIYYYMLLGNEDGAFYLDKNTGDIFTNKSLDREEMDMYALYIQASKKSDLLISERDRMMMSIKKLERDSTVAKVWVTVLDVNDNPPVFKQDVYYAGVSSKAAINELVTIVNATDKDSGANSTMDLFISGSFLYKYGATKTTGSIVPSPFTITKEGRIATANYMAEYNQDRFILEVVAKEVESPERVATAKVYVWIFNPEQLVRVILSRPPSEVHLERDEIVSELSNATQKMIIVDEIRYHVDSMGRIRMDWCDMYIHAIDMETQSIVPVEEILKEIDAKYDFLQDYNAGFSIENVVPAYVTTAQDEFDLALAAIIALLIVLFVGAVSFIVLCCCLKHWVITIPNETRRKDALIKKQIIEDLNTTENPLWIEQKLKLYEEQELTMQVFSEPELTQQHQQQQQQQLNNSSNSTSSTISGSGMGGAGLGLVGGAILHQEQSSLVLAGLAERRDSYELSQGGGDNTYATIQPRNYATNLSTVLGSGGGGGGGTGVGSGGAGGPVPGNAGALVAAGFGLSGEMADYATLRNSRAPSMYEFRGSTFQVQQPSGTSSGADQPDFVTELI
ncbi:cadherin-87A [Uranotaenia lowii]|uniref:cadherin-87A n=1 Tax=Uranotaenia lowii TaxID=190385 RepID=UPI00247B1905|nr:cadherin-87A [Uranotaenia lowii]